METYTAMAYILKIKYKNTMRRVTIPQQNGTGNPETSFEELQIKIRDLFQIPLTEQLVLTYTDKDLDAITMGYQQDLIDACVLQGLNPLRITVTTTHSDTPMSSYQPLLLGLHNHFERLDGFLEVSQKQAFGSVQAIPTSRSRVNILPLEQDSLGYVFHRNIQCDGCGITPIVGSRFKSTKKEDYDLCYSCFKELGNDTDFQRLDRPQRTQPHVPPSWLRCPCPFTEHRVEMKEAARKQMDGKLDSQFIKDVTLIDGTTLPRGTTFTKTWRLKNTGTIPWPRETQLVHVGGDALGSRKAVNLELPQQGLLVNEEVEVSVDLVAPMRVGCYESHWQLKSPSGLKFGHRVWAFLKVAPRGDEQLLQVWESNSLDRGASEVVQNGKYEKVAPRGDKQMPQVCESNSLAQGASEVVRNEKYEKVNHLIYKEGSDGLLLEGYQLVDMKTEEHNESLLESINGELDGGFIVIHKPVCPSVTSPSMHNIDENSGFTEIGDGGLSNEVTTRGVFLQKSTPVEENIPSIVDIAVSDSENFRPDETCLEQLKSMGFDMETLNLELLQKNRNNLQRTIKDLTIASQWNPLLEFIEDMGFNDKELNYRLMLKNNGSVKRVVKELVLMQMHAGRSALS